MESNILPYVKQEGSTLPNNEAIEESNPLISEELNDHQEKIVIINPLKTAKSAEVMNNMLPPITSNVELADPISLCFCGNLCKNIDANSCFPQCTKCTKNIKKKSKSMYLYENEEGALKRYWYTLIGTYLISKVSIKKNRIREQNV